MTCLTAHTDLRPRRREPILLRIVVLAHTSGMAFRAHEVPGLVQSGPVQNIIVLDRFICREMKPSLATSITRSAVPCNRQDLEAAVRERNEILLQRIDAEGIFHFVDGQRSIGTIGLHEKLSILTEEARLHTEIVKTHVVEIAEHRPVGGVLHCPLVLRRHPQPCLRLVTASAGAAADIGSNLRGRRSLVLEREKGNPSQNGSRCHRAGRPEQSRESRVPSSWLWFPQRCLWRSRREIRHWLMSRFAPPACQQPIL